MVTRYSEFGPLNITNYEAFLNLSKEMFNATWKKKITVNETLKDFEYVNQLGEGTFGTVMLVKHKCNESKYHAMKIIPKKKVVEKKQVENTRTEKFIMQSLNHPLMIHLDFFFQDNVYLYFIMPHIPGGDLFSHLRKVTRFDEYDSGFYAAQIILAIEFMHYINFIHRDIKPENILIDHTGYLKLADFGFCKRLEKGRTYTLCGTPEYMAPEVVMHRGYGVAADWWSVGVLIYELCAGSSPFHSKNVKKVFKNIGAGAYQMPLFFSKDVRDIITKLLQENPTRRFGNLKNGANDIKNHRWFHTINWLALLSRKIQAPFQPPLKKIEKRKSLARLDLSVEGTDAYKDIFASF